VDDEELTCAAILVYAVYNATNLFRHQGGPAPRDKAVQALIQTCMNAVQGHAPSQNVMDGRWVAPAARRRRLA